MINLLKRYNSDTAWIYSTLSPYFRFSGGDQGKIIHKCATVFLVFHSFLNRHASLLLAHHSYTPLTNTNCYEKT